MLFLESLAYLEHNFSLSVPNIMSWIDGDDFGNAFTIPKPEQWLKVLISRRLVSNFIHEFSWDENGFGSEPFE